jgi:porin
MRFGSSVAVIFIAVYAGSLTAAEITDRLSIGGVAAGAYQYLDSRGDANSVQIGGGALIVQPELDFRPTGRDQFFLKLGFAAGNGINDDYSEIYPSTPWAVDHEDDLKDINGSGRDYLLTAWYRRSFGTETNRGAITVGIIDATDTLDHNRYANDEYAQFMNAAFVNAANTFFPSYDLGAILEWDIGELSLDAVYMSLDQTGDLGLLEEGAPLPPTLDGEPTPWRYYGFELRYRIRTGAGEGNYALIYSTSSADWINVDLDGKVRRETFLVSIDQDFGPEVGIFFRFGEQDDAALQATYKDLFTMGVDLHGFAWGNIGIGLGQGEGTDQAGFETFRLAETYARWNFSEAAFLTADLQYQSADNRSGEDPSGFVAGLRLTSEF